MMLMDVNVLVYAHREDVKNHGAFRDRARPGNTTGQ